MKRKLLTEAQAWRKVAEVFAASCTPRYDSVGLCSFVDSLHWDLGEIDENTRSIMKARIRDHLDGNGWAYRTDYVAFTFGDGRNLYAADFSDEARQARSMAALWLELEAKEDA